MAEFNNRWLAFLVQHGAQLSSTEPHDVIGFQHPSLPASESRNFICALPALGLTQASGEEAAHFLHNQLTNDVEHLPSSEARLAGYCSPKGRLLASILMWRTEPSIFLQMPREIQPAVQKRLQMFVLRSKVKLADVSDQFAILGLSGDEAASALAHWFDVLPSSPQAKTDSPSGTLVRVNDADGAPRYMWIAPVEVAEQAWPGLTQTLVPRASSAWRLGDIRAGIPQIVRATQEQFVPQMVNFEIVGGVNFKKGCYPGQEIVARSQYLGKLKRRTMRATISTQEPVHAGAEIFSSTDPEQPCGAIVNAEATSDGHTECLVEIKLGMLDEGSIHLGSANGPALAFQPLPYALPTDRA
jgi:folate-binding protein YgfZ